MRSSKTKRTLIGAGAASVIVAAIVIGIVVAAGGGGSDGPGGTSGGGGSGPSTVTSLPKGDLGLTLTANKNDALGVDPKAGFMLTTAQNLSAAQVKAALQPSPSVPLNIEPQSARQFRVTPAVELQPDSMLRLVFKSPETGATLNSWAYQVRAPLRVVATVPNNERTFVPLNTGIELTFSSDDVVDPQANVTITPAVQGRYEQHKRTLVFVPSALEPATLYTVTVKAGLAVKGSDAKLDEPFTLQFETAPANRAPNQQSFNFLRSVNEIATSEPPLIAVQTQDVNVKTMPVQVFAYPDLKTYIADLARLDAMPSWSSLGRDSFGVDTAPLSLALTVNATVEDVRAPGPNSGGGQPYLRFPEKLPPGMYLIQTSYQNRPLQAWLQVTDVATYVSMSDTKTVVWVNDVATGNPLTGVKVELAGASGTLGTTNNEGTAQFDTPKGAYTTTSPANYNTGRTRTAKGVFVVTDPQARFAVVPLTPAATKTYNGTLSDYSAGVTRDYWHFMAADRPIYQPTDKVNVFGVIRAREGDIKRELQIELNVSSGEGRRVGTPQRVMTDDYGAFQTSVELTGAGSGYYAVVAKDKDGNYIDAVYVQVSQYVKPAYRIEARTSKLALMAGEEFDLEIEAKFFDGTPVAGAQLRYTTQNQSGPPSSTPGTSVTTNASGVARAKITATLQEGASTGSPYQGITLNVMPERSEEGEISTSASVVVFPASVAFRPTGEIKSGMLNITGDLSNVDLTVFSQGLQKSLYPFYGYGAFSGNEKPPYLTGPVANAEVNVDVIETRYTRVEIGDRYDFINKVTSKVYRYDPQRVTVPRVTVTTDAQGRFTHTLPAAQGSSYEFTVSALDAQRRTASTRTFAYGEVDRGGPSGTMATLDYEDRVQEGARRFSVGERVPVTFIRGDSAPPSGGKNRYLFFEAQRGLQKVTVQDNPVYNATFSQQSIPSVMIGGVYFNGFTYIETTLNATLRFDPASRKLNIAVTTPKASYGPGEEATVQVQVTDASNKGVAAEVNLAAVDEAVFDIRSFSDYELEISERLYQSVPSGLIRTYTSHQLPVFPDGAGGRGGGGDGGRQSFVDTAYFGTVQTDAAGKAEVKFKLPDNLTSWRVTTYAITRDVFAGKGSGRIAVSQPFFVDLSLNSDYLVTDKPLLRARAYGSGLNANDTVQLSLTALSLGLNAPSTTTGKPFEAITLPLPDLKPGRHELRIEATAGAQKDVITRTIEVVPSRLLTPVLDFKDSVKPGEPPLKGSSDGQTTVIFADAGRGRLLPALQRLRWTYGDRLEQALARSLSIKLLNQYFDQQIAEEALPAELYWAQPLPPTPPVSGSVRNRGVAPVPFASPDLITTAQAAALAPDVFGPPLLRLFLEGVRSDTKETSERQAIALYGLASLGDPVLLYLQSLSASTDLGWRGKLYLALAFKAAGDDAAARKLMDELVKQYNEDQAPSKRLRVGTDQGDSIEATSLMAVLAAGYDDTAADAYFRYLQQNVPRDVPNNIQQLQYLKSALERAGNNGVTFTYSIDGKKQDVSLKDGKTHSLALAPNQLAALRVDAVNGTLSATTLYLTSRQAPTTTTDLTVRRSYTLVGRPSPAGAPIPQDALIEVALDVSFGPQAPGDCYQVTDLLPTGLKPVTRPSYLQASGGGGPPTPPGQPRVTVIRPNLVDGQRVTFCLSRSGPTRVTYYARVAGPGIFSWEPAIMNARATPSVAALSQASIVEIR